MSSIKTTKAWIVQGTNGFDSLKFSQQTPVPELGEHDVLVRFHAASLNYRDVSISKGEYPLPIKENLIPGSDGAGEVLATGSRVTRFQKGDKVLTLFNQGHLGGSLSPKIKMTGLGGKLDGVLRQHGVFSEEGLVSMPPSLSWLEASSLSCAAVTAWNALYGLKPVLPGQFVLTQGTGGVSLFAVQFAKAAGATVIATTSSAQKVEILEKLGADHVINYKEVLEWGAKARSFTPNEEGVDHVIEIGGPATLAQSISAVKIDGIVSIIGYLAQAGQEPPNWMETLIRTFIVRGVMVGNRTQFEDMNRAIESLKIKPVVDSKVFKFSELKEAYQYMSDQKHVGKLCIEID